MRANISQGVAQLGQGQVKIVTIAILEHESIGGAVRDVIGARCGQAADIVSAEGHQIVVGSIIIIPGHLNHVSVAILQLQGICINNNNLVNPTRGQAADGGSIGVVYDPIAIAKAVGFDGNRIRIGINNIFGGRNLH